MTPPDFFAEERWVEAYEATWHPLGSTHTHPGHFVAWNATTQEFRTLTRRELSRESEPARHWLDGFLASDGHRPPVDADPSTQQAWRTAHDKFRRTGTWPRQFRLYAPQDRIDHAAALEPAALVKLASTEFGDIGAAQGILEARISNHPISYPETAQLPPWTEAQTAEAIALCIKELKHYPHRFPEALARVIAESGHGLPADALQQAAYYAAVKRDAWRLRGFLQLLIDIDATGWGGPLQQIANNHDKIDDTSRQLLNYFNRT